MATKEMIFTITADTRQFLSDLKRVSQQLSSLGQGANIPISSASLREVKVAANEAKASVARLSQEQVKIDTSQAKAGLEQVKVSAIGLKSTLQAIATSTVFMAVVHGVSEVGRRMIEGNAQFEKFETTLRVMLGTAEAAKARMAEYAEFAKATPFELPQVVELGNKLQALGRYSVDTMRTLGDLAAASGKPIEQVANAFAKLSSGQKGIAVDMFRDLLITTEDWVKATGRGVKATGELEATAEEMIAALPKILEEKGFAGMMEKQSQTFSGILSNIKDSIDSILREIGRPLFDVLKSLSNALLQVFENPAVKQALTNLGAFIGRVLTSLAPIISSLLNAILPVATNILAAITPLMDALFHTFGVMIDALSPVFALLNDIVAALSPILVILAQMINSILPPVVSLLKMLFSVLGTLISSVLEVLRSILVAIEPALTEIANAIGEILTQLVAALQPVMDDITAMIREYTAALIPLLTELLRAVLPIVQMLVKALGVVGTKVVQIAAWILEKLIPVFQFLVKAIKGVVDVLADMVKWIGDAIRSIGEFFGLVEKKSEKVAKVEVKPTEKPEEKPTLAAAEATIEHRPTAAMRSMTSTARVAKTEMQKLQDEARRLSEQFEQLELQKFIRPESAAVITKKQQEIADRYKQIQERIEGVRKAWETATKSESKEEALQKRLNELKKEYVDISTAATGGDAENRKKSIIEEAIAIGKALDATREASRAFEKEITSVLNPKPEAERLREQFAELKKQFLELHRRGVVGGELDEILDRARQIQIQLEKIKEAEDAFEKATRPVATLAERLKEAEENLAQLWRQWEQAPSEEKSSIEAAIIRQNEAIAATRVELERLQRAQRALIGETTIADIAAEIQEKYGRAGEAIVSFGSQLGKSMETLFATGRVTMKKFGSAMLASVFDTVSQMVDMYAVSIVAWFVNTFTPFVGFPLGMAFVGMIKGLLAAVKPKFAHEGYMKGVIENTQPHAEDVMPVFISPDEVVLPRHIVESNKELIRAWLTGRVPDVTAVRTIGSDYYLPPGQLLGVDVRTAVELEMSPLRARGNDLYAVLRRQNVRKIRRL